MKGRVEGAAGRLDEIAEGPRDQVLEQFPRLELKCGERELGGQDSAEALGHG